MNCQDFENSVNELAREQLMEASVRSQALAHRDECSTCAQRLAEESALSFKLRALATDTSSLAVPPLGSEVLAALHQRQVTARAHITRSRLGTRVVAATATAAALVFVVLAFAFMRSGTPSPNAQGPKNLPVEKANAGPPQLVAGSSPALPGKDPAPTLSGRKQGPTHGAVLAKTATRHGRKNVVTTETTASVVASYPVEVTTDFFPFGYGSATSLGDGGQLVRVELPRSALVAFGVPMNVNRYDERVKADVLFGPDGMAHAIRFVQ